MATPTTALQTAATTTLAVASGVTTLWLTLGALDSPDAATVPQPSEIRIEYVDESGNPLPNDNQTEPAVVVVDQFGQLYVPAEIEATSPTVPEPAVVQAQPPEPESAYAGYDGEDDDHEEEEGD